METGKINGGTRSKWTRNRPLLYGHNRSIPIYRLLYRFTTVTVQQLIIPTGTVLNGDQWMWLRTNFSDQPNIVTGNVATPFNRSSYRWSQPGKRTYTGSYFVYDYLISIIQGSLVINNSSGAVKTYKYIAGDNVISGAQASTYF